MKAEVKKNTDMIMLTITSDDGIVVTFELPYEMTKSTESSIITSIFTKFAKPFEWVWNDCDGYGAMSLFSDRFELTSDGNCDVSGLMTTGGSVTCPMNDAIIEMLEKYMTLVTVLPNPKRRKNVE
jgi:hypothetical protein